MRTVDQLTLKEKIGQLLMVGFEGVTATEEISKLLQEHHAGGVIYFIRNIESTEQVFALTQELQMIATDATGIPLWIAVDQEGGMVARLREGISYLPAAMALGAAHNPELLYEAAKGVAEELRAIGINMNFAPVVDVNINPRNPIIDVRSFGDDPQRVSELGIAAMRGFQDGGIVSVIKHFPGHGDTESDSHWELPVVNQPLERIRQVELVPFRQAALAGAEAVMSAHVGIPALSKGERVPATLSYPILTGVLREEFGFGGLIVTDCMEMEAVSKDIGVPEAVIRAVEAGADIMLVSHTHEVQLAVIQALEDAVRSGRIPEARIDSSVRRILELKQEKAGSIETTSWEDTRIRLENPQTLDALKRLRKGSITVVNHEPDHCTLSPHKSTLVLWPEITQASHSEDVLSQHVSLGCYVKPFIQNEFTEHVYKTNPAREEIEGFAAEAADYDQVVIGIFHANYNPGQLELVNEVLAVRPDAIAVSLRNPVDLAAWPHLKGFVACYEGHPHTLQAVSELLLGRLEPAGRLPVTIPYSHSGGEHSNAYERESEQELQATAGINPAS
ncbi:beta-N-acetylhexosaminidase [Paenibacillus lutrae]|uniref:Beta-N-acetylhexosaminidase n=1 Tax=Paenibacillus lutrae TaxID=2078573 RepID=A0A7X3JZ90_9BACL|nr:beta-N-acetylhexosaminidase [Paenibacillus lutrae]MVO99827.1 beta-N-acetylhexosaminidase [Paenibacillus lutrae]